MFPDGELTESMRYLSQRYASPYREVSALLTDIGTEELAHFEMIGTIVHQLTRNLSMEEIEKSGLGPYYIDHIRFLRQREVVHFQRFGEGLRRVQEDLDPKNFYQFNPGFDRCMK